MPEDDHADDAVVLPDTSEPLGQIRDRDRENDRDATLQSIISAVLDIQKFAVTRENWIKSLECLYLPAEEDEEEGEELELEGGWVGSKQRATNTRGAIWISLFSIFYPANP